MWTVLSLLLGLSLSLGASAGSADAPESVSTTAYNAQTAINELPACPATRRNATFDYIVVGELIQCALS